MKIAVKRNTRSNLQLSLPSGIVLNRLSARLIAQSLHKQGICVSGKQMAAFVKALNRYRRQHPEWVLVEVQDRDGTQVNIRL